MSGRDDVARQTHAREQTRAQIIAELNDRFRRSGAGGRLYLTAGVMNLLQGAVPAIVAAVRRYDSFDAGNDPYGEHDFGAFEHEGEQLFWKIDAYDRELKFASPDPTDPSVTIRVLTVMLAEEW